MYRWQRGFRHLCLVVAVALGVSCQSDEAVAPQAHDPHAPNWSISDALNNHGNSRFFFLPPLVPRPSYSGQSDGTLAPHVLICEWRPDTDRCGTVIADFNAAGGSGSQTVRYDAAAEQYIVNWDTKTCVTGACALSTTQIYRIRVLIGGSQLGFADVDLADNAKEIKNLASSEIVALVNGRTLPIKFRIEKGAAAVVAPGSTTPVGTAGGTVVAAEGVATVDVPAGAVGATTNIGINPAQNPPAGLIDGLAPVVDLGPTGTSFATPATLTLPYDPTKLPAGVPPSALAIYTAVGTGWQRVPGSVVDEATGTVSAPVNHFSVYSVTVSPNTLSGAALPTTIAVGNTTTVVSQIFAYQIVPQTYCYPVYARVGWWTVQTGIQCYTVTQYATYTPANLAVGWSSTSSGVASVPLGPTFTNGQGVATSPPITGVAAGVTNIVASTAGLGSSIPVTVTAPNTPKIVVLSLQGSRPEAPKFDVFLMNPDGSDMRRLAPTLDEQEEYPDLSWDTRTVVFGSTRTGSFQIFRVNADGTGLRQVTNLGFYTRAPRISPDGQRIAFYSDAEGRYNLYTVATNADMAGLGNVQRITSDPADEILPEWSPDGQRLVFSSNRTGTYQLYTHDLKTGYERQLTSDAGDHVSAHWASRGSAITYQNAMTNTLWVVDADDGRAPRQLTSGATDGAPVWSPDGTTVLFTSNRAGGPYSQLHAVNVQSQAVTHFVTTSDAIIPGAWRDPSVHPPAPPTELVAVLSTRGSPPATPKFDVYLMNPDGTNLRALAPTPGEQEEYPDLSRDRSTVVFGSTRSGSFQIFRIKTDGTGLAQVTNLGFYTRAPRLSPDGQRIAFYSDAEGRFNLYTVATSAAMAGLGNVQRITSDPADEILPEWSPDGQRLVFSSNRSGTYQLYVRNLATGDERQITSDPGDHVFARWAPTGARLVYANSSTLWAVDADAGGAPVQLTSPGAIEGLASWSPDGQQVMFGTTRAGLPWAQLYIMNADGSGLRRLSDTQEELDGPSWR